MVVHVCNVSLPIALFKIIGSFYLNIIKHRNTTKKYIFQHRLKINANIEKLIFIYRLSGDYITDIKILEAT